MLTSTIKHLFCAAMLCVVPLPTIAADSANQTPDVSPIYSGDELPFRLEIEQADFQLPVGIHSGVIASYQGKWLLLGGRTNGLHGFNDDNNNFPPQKQNTWVFVVDPKKKSIKKRSLHSVYSGLTRSQIDMLSVTSPQFYQEGETLYITGGYGVDSKTGQFSTKDVLTAINIPGLMRWVINPGQHCLCKEPAAKSIRQIRHPIFQVTGGYMSRMQDHSTLLVFGQNFEGVYTDGSNGAYTQQVRRFRIIDDGKKLAVQVEDPKPDQPDPNYRRRDLNVVPAIECRDGRSKPYLIALSGVFTLDGGAWTVPVTITASGRPSMQDPSHPSTFKQGMNNYACATVGLFSKERRDYYCLLLGGISYGYFNGASFETDPEMPFINQVTAICRNECGQFSQYLLEGQYPEIISNGYNPGNPLLFGAGAQFVAADDLAQYSNGVLKLDAIKKPLVIGYVVGGIQSTLPNTNTMQDSGASPYIFKVVLTPKGC